MATVVAAAALFAVSIGVAPPAGAEPSGSEQELASLVNQFRAQHGKPPLQLAVGMSNDSRAWSEHMAATGLAHDPNFAQTCERYFDSYSFCSENVGYASSVQAVQTALENSASHRASLLCDCTHLGVGVVVSGNRTYATQRFVNADQQPQVQSAPAPAAPVQYSQAEVDDAKRFIRAAYTDIVRREPSSADLDHWGARAVTAAQRAQLVHALSYSGEALGPIVDLLYQAALDRPADAAGRNHWIRQLQGGVATADVVVRFYASNEHFATVKQDLGRWVDDIYREFLGRPADAAGRDHWAAVARRDGRGAVARRLHDSSESMWLRIDRAYQHLLGRSADPAGLAHWTAMLRWTRNDVHLGKSLATSAEYRIRALDRF